MLTWSSAFSAFDTEGVDMTYTPASWEGATARDIIATSRGLPMASATMELFD